MAAEAQRRLAALAGDGALSPEALDALLDAYSREALLPARSAAPSAAGACLFLEALGQPLQSTVYSLQDALGKALVSCIGSLALEDCARLLGCLLARRAQPLHVGPLGERGAPGDVFAQTLQRVVALGAGGAAAVAGVLSTPEALQAVSPEAVAALPPPCRQLLWQAVPARCPCDLAHMLLQYDRATSGVLRELPHNFMNPGRSAAPPPPGAAAAAARRAGMRGARGLGRRVLHRGHARGSCGGAAKRGALPRLCVRALANSIARCRCTGPTPQQAPCAVPPLRPDGVPHPALTLRVVRVPRDGHAPVRLVDEGAAAAYGRHGAQRAPQDDAAALQEWVPRGHAGEEDDGQERLDAQPPRFLPLCVCVMWCAGTPGVPAVFSRRCVSGAPAHFSGSLPHRGGSRSTRREPGGKRRLVAPCPPLSLKNENDGPLAA